MADCAALHRQHGLQRCAGYSSHPEPCALQARCMGRSRLHPTTGWASSPSALWRPRPALVRLPTSTCCVCTCSQSDLCRLPAWTRSGFKLQRASASRLGTSTGSCVKCHSQTLWFPSLTSLQVRLHCIFRLSLEPRSAQLLLLMGLLRGCRPPSGPQEAAAVHQQLGPENQCQAGRVPQRPAPRPQRGARHDLCEAVHDCW